MYARTWQLMTKWLRNLPSSNSLHVYPISPFIFSCFTHCFPSFFGYFACYPRSFSLFPILSLTLWRPPFNMLKFKKLEKCVHFVLEKLGKENVGRLPNTSVFNMLVKSCHEELDTYLQDFLATRMTLHKMNSNCFSHFRQDNFFKKLNIFRHTQSNYCVDKEKKSLPQKPITKWNSLETFTKNMFGKLRSLVQIPLLISQDKCFDSINLEVSDQANDEAVSWNNFW